MRVFLPLTYFQTYLWHVFPKGWRLTRPCSLILLGHYSFLIEVSWEYLEVSQARKMLPQMGSELLLSVFDWALFYRCSFLFRQDYKKDAGGSHNQFLPTYSLSRTQGVRPGILMEENDISEGHVSSFAARTFPGEGPVLAFILSSPLHCHFRLHSVVMDLHMYVLSLVPMLFKKASPSSWN